MGAIGDQPFTSLNVAGGPETTLFDFKLLGRVVAFFRVSGIEIECTTGASDYLVRMYQNNIPLSHTFRAEKDGFAKLDLSSFRIVLNQGDDFRATVQHVEALNQDFRSTLVGSGVI